MRELKSRSPAGADLTQRGQEMYERDILPTLDASARGKFLVLDVETGDYEFDRDELAALKRLRSRRPEALVYLLRVGFPAAYRIGSGSISAPRC
jgi:hypothetical protein